MTPTAPSRTAALRLAGLADDVPDWALADHVAEATGLDAATLRRGWALDRARRLLVELAAHDGCGPVCEMCRAPCPPENTAEETWCQVCAAFRRRTPTPADLLALLREALREADDPRAWIAATFDAALAAASLCDDRRCPDCGVTTISVTPRRCGDEGCGWSGPASALLRPLLTRAELDAGIAEMRKGRA